MKFFILRKETYYLFLPSFILPNSTQAITTPNKMAMPLKALFNGTAQIPTINSNTAIIKFFISINNFIKKTHVQ